MKKTKRALYYQRIINKSYAYVSSKRKTGLDYVKKPVVKISKKYGIEYTRIISHSNHNANFSTYITADIVYIDILGTKCTYVDWMNSMYFTDDKTGKYKIRRCRFYSNDDIQSTNVEELTSLIDSLPMDLSEEEEFQYSLLYENFAVMNKAYKFVRFIENIKNKSKHVRPIDLIMAARHIGIDV